VGDDGWSSVVSGHTTSLLSPGDVVLERLMMLGGLALIAIGIVTGFFW